ncbi:MAG TPA: sialidase family protein [Candidatus Kapabacteria bacterium]|nr:sialidase family protein [Candidatus Kapabacteria bacterium]
MSKQLVFILIVLTVLLYAVSTVQWFQSQETTPASFVQDVPVLFSFPAPSFQEEEFISPAGDNQVHAASIAELKDGTLAAVWYGGKYEGSPDTQIYFATRSRGSQIKEWSSPCSIVNRISAAKELNRYIKKIGNPLLFTDNENRLQLLFVSVSIGGWSGSSLNLKVSPDSGKTWTPSQRLTLSPFFNISELVRNNPLQLANGDFVVPIYHECLGIFSELLWLKPGTGPNIPPYFKTRLTWGTGYLQPSMISTSPHSAAVFHRSHRDKSYVTMSFTNDTGATWTAPQKIDIPNPGSGLNALRLSDGRILLAFNDSPIRRDNLTLAVSNKGPTEGEYTERHGKEFQQWQRVAVLENTPGEEFSYPYMIRTRDGKIHLVYTWQRKRIKHVTFNEEWLEKRIK